MSLIPIFRSIRLIPKNAEDLDRSSGSKGEIFYDTTEDTLRVFDGEVKGGYSLLRKDLTNLDVTTLNLGSGSITASQFNGPLNGNATTVTHGVYTTDIGTVTNSMLVNSSLVINGTTVSLGGSVTVSSISGNAGTASRLAQAVSINGTAFDGSANVTVTADANTLTNTTLNDSVVNSSLTQVGTLTALEVSGEVTVAANIVVPTKPTRATHASNKKYVDTRSIAMSIAMS